MKNFESPSTSASERPLLHSLLRTPEETLPLRERLETPYLFIQFRVGDRMMSLLGLRHTLDIEKVEEIKKSLQEAHPELLLHETDTVITETKKDISTMRDPREVLRVAGEQGYLAWIGQQAGMNVKTWDIPVAEWAQQALATHALPDVQAFFAAQVAKILLTSGKPATEKEIRSVLEAHLPQEALPKETISEVLRKYTNKNLADVTVDDLETIVSPYGTGPTNRIIREVNQARDMHAIDVIATEAATHKKLFITGGVDHILTWEPAIRQIYNASADKT